jgi:hypothetical protein
MIDLLSNDDESRPLLRSPSRHEGRSDNDGKWRAAEGNYKDFRSQRGFDCCSLGCQRAFVEFLRMLHALYEYVLSRRSRLFSNDLLFTRQLICGFRASEYLSSRYGYFRCLG